MKSGFQRARETGNLLLGKLRRRFSPTRLLRTRDDLIMLREGARNAEWVISRGLSLFVGVNCANVPRKRRDALVATSVKRAAPFSLPGWHASWRGDQAMVWVWPQEELTSGPELEHRAAPADIASSNSVSYIRRFLPESLLRGEALDAGVELVECSDGVEARAWRNGCIYASNWWPTCPDAHAWATFCRGAGQPPVATPEVKRFQLRDVPWSATRDSSVRDWTEHVRRLALPLVLCTVALAAAFQVGALVRVKLAMIRLQERIDQSSAKVSDILDARRRAEDDLASVKALLAMRPPMPHVKLLAVVADVLDQNRAKIVQWSSPNPDSIEVVISMSTPDPRALVIAFQKSGYFSDVTADVGRGGKDQLIIRAKVIRIALLPSVSDAVEKT